MRFGVVAAAVDLQNQGRTATIVDLTEAGNVASRSRPEPPCRPATSRSIFRPRVVPSLAERPGAPRLRRLGGRGTGEGKEPGNPHPRRSRPRDRSGSPDCLDGFRHRRRHRRQVERRTGADGRRSRPLRGPSPPRRGAPRAVRDDTSSGVSTPVEEGARDTRHRRPAAGIDRRALLLSHDHPRPRSRSARAPRWLVRFLGAASRVGRPLRQRADVRGHGASVLIPQSIGQLIAQGMVLVALVLALLANPGMVVRPNIFLTLLTAMAVLALMVSIHNEFLVGSTYRAVRLISSSWSSGCSRRGGADQIYPCCGHTCSASGSSSPRCGSERCWLPVRRSRPPVGSQACSGRSPPPQVAHYAAVLFGCTVILWFCGVVAGRGMARDPRRGGGCSRGDPHQNGAAGAVLGLVVAGASLSWVTPASGARLPCCLWPRERWIVFSPLIVSWLARGQSAQDLTQLTGRTKVWAALAQQQVHDDAGTIRNRPGQQIVQRLAHRQQLGGYPLRTGAGSGWRSWSLSCSPFCSAAVTRPAGPRRAIALFFIVYCVTASFTETGLGDASPYLLDLAVAASLLVSPPKFARRGPRGQRAPATPDHAT